MDNRGDTASGSDLMHRDNEPHLTGAKSYPYSNLQPTHTKAKAYLWPVVFSILSDRSLIGSKVFELGCGNGAFAAELARRGYNIVGVDPSESGIPHGKAKWPDLELYTGSGYDNLKLTFGQFPVVVSLEVIEHVYAPRRVAETIFDLVEPGGIAIISTPYHGYLKNLSIVMSGKFDNHFSALKDNGHIKFWSVRTLRKLLQDAGFVGVEFAYAGRIYPLSKSMIAIACRP